MATPKSRLRNFLQAGLAGSIGSGDRRRTRWRPAFEFANISQLGACIGQAYLNHAVMHERDLVAPAGSCAGENTADLADKRSLSDSTGEGFDMAVGGIENKKFGYRIWWIRLWS